MPRFSTNFESAAAAAAGTAPPLANLAAGASANYRLRRLTIGFRTAGAITSGQVTPAIFRVTARGTASTTVTPLGEDPRAAATAITGLDTVWSVNPTVAANAIWKPPSINTQSAFDYSWEFPDDFICDNTAANGLALAIIGNALPAGYILVANFVHDE